MTQNTNTAVPDWAQIRAETPGTAERLHLDNCGSSLLHMSVITRMKTHFELEIALGGYVAQERTADEIEGFYASAARLIGAKPAEIALTSSAVDAWTKAFYSLDWQAGETIVTAYNEYCSNYVAYLDVAEKKGVKIRVARSDPAGGLDYEHLAGLVDSSTRLISLSHVSSSSGDVIDAVRVGATAKAAQVPFLLDACQSVGQMPVDVGTIGCDMLSATSRKFVAGPRGVGMLYMSEAMRARTTPAMPTNQSAVWSGTNTIERRTDARAFEAWERSVMLQLGFKQAIDNSLHWGVEAVSARISDRAKRLRDGLASLDCVRPTCPPGAEAAIITFQHARLSPQDFKAWMDARGIGVQVASVVHTRLDLEARGIESTIRISPHIYTSDDEIDRFLSEVQRAGQ